MLHDNDIFHLYYMILNFFLLYLKLKFDKVFQSE